MKASLSGILSYKTEENCIVDNYYGDNDCQECLVNRMNDTLGCCVPCGVN